MNMPTTTNDACDYIIAKCGESDVYLNVLKLHKLLYYAQAWHLAFEGDRCFDSDFQAWIHGPVSRPIYDRFSRSKTMYSRVTQRDIREGFEVSAISEDIRAHIDGVLEVYAEYSDSQLEEMTHREEPWLNARGDCSPTRRCERVIGDADMKAYYSARLARA